MKQKNSTYRKISVKIDGGGKPMWNRTELKQRARMAFKKNYWTAVVTSIVLGIAIAAVTAFSGFHAGGETLRALSETSFHVSAGIGGAALLALLFNFFVMKPLEVGARRYFLNISEGHGDINDILYGFNSNYMNNALAMFLKDMIISLWSLLFIIPGVIKMYAYRMVPYIMAENPEMDGSEALKISEEMMNGHKWDAFVLDLTFLGWKLLSIFTLGIAGVFYVNPYVYTTDAELYKAIKNEYNGPEVEESFSEECAGQMA